MFDRTRRLVVAAIVAVLALAVPLTITALTITALAGPAAATAVAPTKSGVLTLGATSGSITGTLKLAVTPAAGAGRQICDPANESYGVVYASVPGDEDGVAGESVNYTILAPTDGSLIPAGGTLTDFLPTVMDPVFPATGGSPPLDSSTNGTLSLGVRCQDGTSTQIFQNYWTTITVRNGAWTVGVANPTTSTTPSSSTGSTGSTMPTTPQAPVRSGPLAISPTSGRLLSGSYTLTPRPTTAGAPQVCGDVQSFAVLYFAPLGHEFDPVGGAVSIKARPVQASGLDIPISGSLIDFLPTAGAVDFSQSLGASDSWQQSLTAGRYSLGVRCQSGLADAPIIYQNYFTTVTLTADGSWSVDGAPRTTSTSPSPTTTTTTTRPAGTVTLSVADATGHLLPSPTRVTVGQHLFISAAGFETGENVVVAVHSTAVTLATVAAVNGGIAAAIVIPSNLPAGTHTLSVTGSTSGRTGILTMTVASAAAGSTATTMSVRTATSVAGTSTASSSTTVTTSTTSNSATSGDPSSTTSNPLPSNNNADSPGPGSLAYTGFPVTDSLTTAALLLGFGIALLTLTLGPAASGRVRSHDHH